MARSTCRAADGWPNAPTLRAPFSRWWENAATTASDISSPSHHAIVVSVKRKLSVLPPHELANLEMILGVEFLPAQLLDREMFRMGGPRTQRVGRLPFKQREPLAIFRHIPFVGYVTRHLAGKLAHAKEPSPIFLALPL